MYYIVDDCERYYAGKCCSDNKTLVWKNHHVRALYFDTPEKALDYAISEGIDFETIEYVEE